MVTALKFELVASESRDVLFGEGVRQRQTFFFFRNICKMLRCTFIWKCPDHYTMETPLHFHLIRYFLSLCTQRWLLR